MEGIFLIIFAFVTFVSGDVIVYTLETPHSIEDEFRDLPASFGGDLPVEGLRGFLVVAAPNRTGCEPLQSPPSDDNFTGKWILLIARYGCNFETKVRNAQNAGYDCAIVHNVNSSDLETMSAKDPEGITIPSVFVNEVAGITLGNAYVYTKGYYLVVNGDPPFNINTRLLLPFAIVVALCLLVMLIFMIVKCIKDRRRARRHRLPSRALKKIPTCKFSKGDPYDTCAICLDDYVDGDRLRVLPCAHAYHAKCIDPWLTRNRRVCPVCKRRVLAAGERRAHSDTDSDDSRDALLPEADAPRTQGGTFEEQRENPFVRAARFMSRLRSRPADTQETNQPSEEAPAAVEHDQTNDNNEQDSHNDTQPLIQPSVRSETERRPRRTRRHRSASSSRPRASPAATSTPVLRSAEHSINREEEARGEIGVAALPVAPNAHVNL